MLLHYNQTSDILCYEILDMHLPELQGLRTLKVAFRIASNNEIEVHNNRVPKENSVGDVLDELRIKEKNPDLLYPNMVKYIQLVFYVTYAISKKEMKEISA